MGRLIRILLCASALITLLNVELRFDSPDAAASRAANATVAASYDDARPAAPNGYLCVHGAKGRLNNLILQKNQLPQKPI